MVIASVKNESLWDKRECAMNELDTIKTVLGLTIGAITAQDNGFIKYQVKDPMDSVPALELLYEKIENLCEYIDMNFRG